MIIPYNNELHRPQVVALWESIFGYDAGHNRPGLSLDKKLAARDDLLFVAMDGDSVVGTIMGGYDGHRGWIYSVAVAPTHRRHGIGTQLVRHAESALTARGCVKINLQILEGNASVTAFYEKLGYAVEKRINMGKRIPENVP